MTDKIKLGYEVDTGKQVEMIKCACGCGAMRPKYDKKNRVMRYINRHHVQKGKNNLNYKSEIHTDEKVSCACGCEGLRLKFDKGGKERKYIWGHKNRFEKGKHYSRDTEFKKGHKLSRESEMKRRESLSNSRNGMEFTESHCENISKGKKGIPNPKVGIFLTGRTGENSRNWKGGLSFEEYGIEFNRSLKEKIRERDNCECQYDHKAQRILGELLSVHHIDYNKKNNNPLNLISLCRKCHLKTNKDREFWKRYFQMYQFIRLILFNPQEIEPSNKYMVIKNV